MNTTKHFNSLPGISCILCRDDRRETILLQISIPFRELAAFYGQACVEGEHHEEISIPFRELAAFYEKEYAEKPYSLSISIPFRELAAFYVYDGAWAQISGSVFQFPSGN